MRLSELKKKLGEMAQLSILSNRISTIQEKNLKMFPFVFFEGLDSVRIEYDLGHGVDEKTNNVLHKSLISYYLTLDETANHLNKEHRFLAIERAVRELFWKDIFVEVYWNNSKVYGSENV
jgi:hypothetical protein